MKIRNESVWYFINIDNGMNASHLLYYEKCPYSKLLWSAYSSIRTEYGEYLSLFSPNAGKFGPE